MGHLLTLASWKEVLYWPRNGRSFSFSAIELIFIPSAPNLLGGKEQSNPNTFSVGFCDLVEGLVHGTVASALVSALFGNLLLPCWIERLGSCTEKRSCLVCPRMHFLKCLHMNLLILAGALKVPSLFLTREAGSNGVINFPDIQLSELVAELLHDSPCTLLRFEWGEWAFLFRL